MTSSAIIKSNLPQVVILGRTNVGKSTLFNKLAEKYEAMVSDIAGTTRDIKKSLINWQGYDFELIDTGGLTGEHLAKFDIADLKHKYRLDERIEYKIIEKALGALKDAALVLFVVDARSGPLKEDKDIANWLLKNNDKKAVLVANKADGVKLRQATAEFYKLGFGTPLPVSATTGSGTGDLLDIIVEKLGTAARHFADNQPPTYDLGTAAPIRVSIIGRPNVGKSSLLNKLLGEERVIVSPLPHTTREPIDTEILYKDQQIIIADTAGIRRKAKIELTSLEKQGVGLSLKSLDQADVILLVIDPSQDIGQQDQKLAQLIIDKGAGVMVVLNKMDLFQSGRQDSEQPLENRDSALVKTIHRTFNYLDWAPVILISALTGKNVHKIFDLILRVSANHSRKADQTELDRLRKKLVFKQPPPGKRPTGRKGTRAYKPKLPPKIVNLKQTDIAPPHFEIVYKGAGMLPMNYLKYIEKGLRETFDFGGTPVIIHQSKI